MASGAEGSGAEGSGAAVRVLVVDDSQIMCELAARMLRGFGCTVELARGGKQALALLAAGSFDLVLMDCQMPDIDGYSAVREYRGTEKQRNQGKRVPIVAMTGDTGSECRSACFDAGMDDYLGKPFTLADLRGVLERWVRLPVPLP